MLGSLVEDGVRSPKGRHLPASDTAQEPTSGASPLALGDNPETTWQGSLYHEKRAFGVVTLASNDSRTSEAVEYRLASGELRGACA